MVRTWLESRSERLFLGPKSRFLAGKLRFLPYDPYFGQRPVCSPRRDRSFPTMGAFFRLSVQQEWTFTQAMNFPWGPTLITRKTRKMLTRRRISPIQKNTEVTATDKIEAKTGDTEPHNIFIVISVPWTTMQWLSGIYFHICDWLNTGDQEECTEEEKLVLIPVLCDYFRRIWKY